MGTPDKTLNKTHPWLQFKVDLRRAPPTLWAMLGECQSKCEHISGVPLRPGTQEELHKIYLAKGSLATTAIEGNTLSEEEVLEHLEGRLQLPPSRRYLAKEIDNIVFECNRLLDAVMTGKPPPVSSRRIEYLNGRVLDGLQVAEEVEPGRIRGHPVIVGRYRPPDARFCEGLLDQLCDWLNGEAFEPREGMAIIYAVIKAVLAHLYLAWIHPFGDGNGRTARLLEFQILISSGVPAPSAHLLSSHYNQTRTEYYRQLDLASRSGGKVLAFLEYAVQGFLDGLREQLQLIRDQQWDVVWRNYVHEAFKDKSSEAHERRRRLALDLSSRSEPIPIGKIPQVSARMAEAYARKTRKTLSRDINELVEMGLVEKKGQAVRARREIILAFLPATAGPDQA